MRAEPAAPARKVRIKVCCIANEEEASIAIRLGASAIGLVSQMPSGPGVISEDAIRRIARTIPPGVSSFLLTCHQSPRAIIEQHRRCRTSTIQICDTLDGERYDLLRDALPGISLVQVIHVHDDSSLDEAIRIAPFVDALLLDSGNQKLAIKELGGTGRVHDWTVSRKIVESTPVPVFLAGGLNGANVREAIANVRPFGVDVCSGVRTAGGLDQRKLAELVEAALAH